jgi:hypothetical protein
MAASRVSFTARVLNVLAITFLLWIVLGSFVGWLLGLSPRRPQEGDPCGPGYRWTRIGSPNNPDLSCERE